MLAISCDCCCWRKYLSAVPYVVVLVLVMFAFSTASTKRANFCVFVLANNNNNPTYYFAQISVDKGVEMRIRFHLSTTSRIYMELTQVCWLLSAQRAYYIKCTNLLKTILIYLFYTEITISYTLII